MAPPKKETFAALQKDVSEAIGNQQALEERIRVLEAKVSALIRQDLNAINAFAINGPN